MKKILKVYNSPKNTVEIHFDEKIVLIDREDAVLFFSYSYRPCKAGNTWYLHRTENNTTKMYHIDVMNPPKKYLIDHINGNGLDNRKSNLAIVTSSENNYNRKKRKDCLSSYIGVSIINRNKKYIASARLPCGKQKTIGLFHDELEAAWARENFIIKNESLSKKNFE